MLEVSVKALSIMLSVMSNFNIEEPIDNNAIYCSSINAYYEAADEDFLGKVAVSFVAKKRASLDRWPNTLCEVVEQRKLFPVRDEDGNIIRYKYICQFSWFCDGRTDKPFLFNAKGEKHKSNSAAYRQSSVAAMLVQLNLIKDITGGATHYYAHNLVTPSWAKSMYVTAIIGNHTFLKEKN